jgi:hypothetical protein
VDPKGSGLDGKDADPGLLRPDVLGPIGCYSINSLLTAMRTTPIRAFKHH